MVVQPNQTDFESLVSWMNLDQSGGSGDLVGDLLGEQQRDFETTVLLVPAHLRWGQVELCHDLGHVGVSILG